MEGPDQSNSEYDSSTKYEKGLPRLGQPFFVFGAGTMNRTRDLLITNQLLYQLSYTGIVLDATLRNFLVLSPIFFLADPYKSVAIPCACGAPLYRQWHSPGRIISARCRKGKRNLHKFRKTIHFVGKSPDFAATPCLRHISQSSHRRHAPVVARCPQRTP